VLTRTLCVCFRRYDGLLAGDNTALPRNLPAASMDSPTAISGGSFLDLNTMSYAELMAAAARSTSGSEPLGDLLSINPSMMRKRQAFVTGLEPLIGLRQKTGSGPLSDATAMVLPEEAAVMLAEYLEGHRNDVPWHALGVSKPIVIDGEMLSCKLSEYTVDSPASHCRYHPEVEESSVIPSTISATIHHPVLMWNMLRLSQIHDVC